MENPHSNPTTWLGSQYWDEFCRLDEMGNYKGIRSKFITYKDAWKAVYDSVVSVVFIFTSPVFSMSMKISLENLFILCIS